MADADCVPVALKLAACVALMGEREEDIDTLLVVEGVRVAVERWVVVRVWVPVVACVRVKVTLALCEGVAATEPLPERVPEAVPVRP